MKYDLLIKNGKLVSGQRQKKSDIAIKDGKIALVADVIVEDASEIIDAKGLHVLPGVIDSQVHFRDPGLTHKEDLETGSKAAALGGVCTFLEMPNTNPSTTTVKALDEKIALGNEKSVVNFGFFIGATGENLDEIEKCVKKTGCPGVKIFLGSSTGDLLLYDQDKLLQLLLSIKAPVAVHSENEIMLRERKQIQQDATSAHDHPVWRNEDTALSSTQMIIDLCKKAGRKVHILHLTTEEEVNFLREQKDHCTIEATPQHLTLFAPDCYDRLGTYAQMNPPIREKRHLEALWKGVQDGTIDVFGSDHAPHTKEEKDKGYPASPSGMPGVQTMLPLFLNHMNNGLLSLEKIVTMLCERPAELYQLSGKGKLEKGYDGDVTLVDINREHTITNAEQASKVGWTPFDGMKIKGMPVATIVGGTIVMKNGVLTGKKAGKPIKHR